MEAGDRIGRLAERFGGIPGRAARGIREFWGRSGHPSEPPVHFGV